VNREFKRRMKREERAQQRAQMRGRAPIPVQGQQQRRERVGMRQYLRDIQTELGRVIWPTPQEVVTYSIVVVVVVTVLTLVVFGLDYVFFKGVLRLFTPSG
jgi:preprotein translocase subunit SecE